MKMKGIKVEAVDDFIENIEDVAKSSKKRAKKIKVGNPTKSVNANGGDNVVSFVEKVTKKNRGIKF